jgi:hypothetical protein
MRQHTQTNTMKDTRVAFFRKTLESLLESLDATVRVTRWEGPDGVPEPLKETAGHLVTRLGTAHRLASSAFTGSPTDAARVQVMLGAMRRLDAAYVAYRQRADRPAAERETAAMALDAEIAEVSSDSRWRA